EPDACGAGETQEGGKYAGVGIQYEACAENAMPRDGATHRLCRGFPRSADVCAKACARRARFREILLSPVAVVSGRRRLHERRRWAIAFYSLPDRLAGL